MYILVSIVAMCVSQQLQVHDSSIGEANGTWQCARSTIKPYQLDMSVY